MKALIFDTETTDLIKNSVVGLKQQPSIIEFFGEIVDLKTGEKLEELEFLCHPGFEILPVTTKITGITPEQLKGLPSFKHFEGKVRAIINSAEAVIAHNLSYDYAVVMAELERCNTMDAVKWPMRRICTVEQTEWIKGFRLNLTSLHEELFGEAFKGAHRARTDVEALTRCCLELFKRGDI